MSQPPAPELRAIAVPHAPARSAARDDVAALAVRLDA